MYGDSVTTATKRRAGAAVKKFDAFLATHYPGEITLASFTSDDITHELMAEFASYMFEDPAISFSSSSTYLSSINSQIEEKNRTNFFERLRMWYGRLRYRPRDRCVLKTSEEKEPMQVKVPLMTLDDFRLLASALIKTGKQANSRTER